MRVEITLPIKLVSEANQREHWAKKAARVKRQRGIVRVALMAATTAAERATLPSEVVITRIAPRRLDDDNAVGACKAVRDSIAAVFGFDDRNQAVRWTVNQERGAAKEYAVRIVIV